MFNLIKEWSIHYFLMNEESLHCVASCWIVRLRILDDLQIIIY
jgi:hypothetical protein